MFVVFSMPPGSAMYLMCGMSRNPKWFLLVLLIGIYYPCMVTKITKPPETLHTLPRWHMYDNGQIYNQKRLDLKIALIFGLDYIRLQFRR